MLINLFLLMKSAKDLSVRLFAVNVKGGAVLPSVGNSPLVLTAFPISLIVAIVIFPTNFFVNTGKVN
jgi:hypothetical protein